MENLLTVALEAHHAGKNHHRRYEVTVGHDLLDDWTVAIRYGRIGQGGQERHYASPKPEEMRAVIRDRLCRRLSAPKRIGCPYRLAAFSSASGFDATAWLPRELMTRVFFAVTYPAR
jgi:predicted DNA-binding WGR domain protein